MEAKLQSNKFADMTIGEIVAEDYRTSRVFERHGIDFCCGGKTSISVACKEKGIDESVLLDEIEGIKKEAADRSSNYASWEIPFLTDYIVNIHHTYLKDNTGQIAANARKIAEVHGKYHPEVIEIATIFEKIATDMAAHLLDEENVFFPALKRLDSAAKKGETPDAADVATVRSVLAQLGHEHDEIGDAVHRIRALAKSFEVPDDVCPTFRITYLALNEFEDDLHKHVHLENNVLFPKAEKILQAL